jgi:hypothetical protein
VGSTTTTTTPRVLALLLLLLTCHSGSHTCGCRGGGGGGGGRQRSNFWVYAAEEPLQQPHAVGGGGIGATSTGTDKKMARRSAVHRIVHELRNHGATTRTKNRKPFVFSGILMISKQQVRAAIAQCIQDTVHWEDVAFLAAIGWLTMPALSLLYAAIPAPFLMEQHPHNRNSRNGQKKKKRPYRETWFHLLADHLQQISQIALSVYAVDANRIIAGTAILNGPEGHWTTVLERIPHAYCQAAYAVWMANRGKA